jgi:hypothetical protein
VVLNVIVGCHEHHVYFHRLQFYYFCNSIYINYCTYFIENYIIDLVAVGCTCGGIFVKRHLRQCFVKTIELIIFYPLEHLIQNITTQLYDPKLKHCHRGLQEMFRHRSGLMAKLHKIT